MAFITRGIIPPVVTPTDENGSFNPVMFDKLLNHLLEGGVHGVFPFGTTGEFYAFEEDDYRRIITQAVETVNHRVPVYAGANSITTKGTIRLAKVAKECGADALSVLTPMFISQTQAELYEHYRAIAESTDLPIIIYNNRPKTNVHVTPETVAKLAEIPNIASAAVVEDSPERSRFTITASGGDIYDLYRSIFRAFAASGHALCELGVKKARLEDIFLELTEGGKAE